MLGCQQLGLCLDYQPLSLCHPHITMEHSIMSATMERSSKKKKRIREGPAPRAISEMSPPSVPEKSTEKNVKITLEKVLAIKCSTITLTKKLNDNHFAICWYSLFQRHHFPQLERTPWQLFLSFIKPPPPTYP